MKAQESRKQMEKTKRKLQQEINKNQKLLASIKAELKHVSETINNLKGPFQTKFDSVMDALNLKRQVYHSRALVGGDVHKVLKTRSIKKLVRVFRPLKVPLRDGGTKQFGDVQTMNRISTLLFKLSACYKLYSPSVPLCRHEVAFLSVRCASIGGWFPINFPNVGLLRKFHVLTFHVPVKAARLRSVGMEAEHCSESIHPVVNKLDRTYATIQNKCNRLALVTKSQWLQSNSNLRNFRKTKKQGK